MRKLPWLCLLAALSAGTAFSVDFTALKPTGYLSDFSNVVDAASKDRIEQYCSAVEKATGAQMALVTIPSLQGEPVEDVANALFRKWGVGQKGQNNGILLLLVTGDRKSRLEVGYGIEPIIPDGFAGDILRSMRPYLREGQYGAALQVAAADIGSAIAKAKGVTIDAAQPQPAPERRTEPPVPWAMLLFGGFFLLLLVVRRIFRGIRGGRDGGYYGGGGGGLLPGILLGNLLGGGGSNRDGGGFGGFDGGGFGGFGGGDSGGGGASSDW